MFRVRVFKEWTWLPSVENDVLFTVKPSWIPPSFIVYVASLNERKFRRPFSLKAFWVGNHSFLIHKCFTLFLFSDRRAGKFFYFSKIRMRRWAIRMFYTSSLWHYWLFCHHCKCLRYNKSRVFMARCTDPLPWKSNFCLSFDQRSKYKDIFARAKKSNCKSHCTDASWAFWFISMVRVNITRVFASAKVFHKFSREKCSCSKLEFFRILRILNK